MPSISGQSILVIGGSSGIGFSVAKLALAENVRVAIASSNEAKVKDAVERLKATSPNGQVTGHTIDLLSKDPEAQLTKLFSDVSTDRPIDHIIMTANRASFKPLADIDIAWLSERVHLPGFINVLIAKLGPQYLSAGPKSSIIFTSGTVAEKPLPGHAVLGSFAINVYGLTRGLALDLAPVRVNAVSPGATETELWGPQKDMLRERVGKKSLLRKVAQPDEVAEAYIYLMKNTDATGSIVSSDAGSHLQ